MPQKTEKTAPSGNPMFIMKKMDWGIHMPMQTDKWEYYVYSDGNMEYQYNGCYLGFDTFTGADDYWSGLRTQKMSDENFSTLCKLLQKFPKNCATGNACDGTGYEMTLYDSEGNVIHKTSGYIYGNTILKKIVDLITK